MGQPEIERRLTEQRGLVAVWQLARDGYSPATIRHAVRPLREVHDGVYLSGHAPLTAWQGWKAATLTTPATFLGDWSAASFLSVRETADRQPTTVLRHGSGGLEYVKRSPGRVGAVRTEDRLGALRIRRSSTLATGTTVVDGIPCTTVSRTALDLMPHLGDARADRMVRDILRLKLATPVELRAQIALSKGARGVVRLRALVDEYAALPAGRTKSDAEILAVALLAAAGIALPEVNVVVAGGEGDLVWRQWRLIVELDGPQYHQFAAYDARKQHRWERAGWTVRRLPTDDVYHHPHRLLSAARDPNAATR